MAKFIKKWNGTVWTDAAVKKYNGSANVDVPTKKYDGTKWVQLYPETAVTVTNEVVSAKAFNSFRPKWSNWDAGTAKQGNGSSYGGDTEHYGYMDIDISKLPGNGIVSKVNSCKFTGVRGGAGSYNNDQTIKFYRSNIKPTSSPAGTHSGLFTCKTGAGVGSGGTMSNRDIVVTGTNGTNLLNWMNKVNGKQHLYIYDNTTTDYLSIQTSAKMVFNYTYTPTRALFVKDEDLNRPVFANIEHNHEDIYHEMLLYYDEIDMSLEEIIRHRTENNIEDIPLDSIIDLSDIKPYTSEYSIKDNKLNVDIHSTKDGHIAEFTYDGINYMKLNPGSSFDSYIGDLPDDFDKYRDNILVRVRDEIKDIIETELLIEPDILIV